MEKKEEEFDYAAEQAKQSFQANIGSLLEFNTLFDSKAQRAKANGKEGAFFSLDELEVLKGETTRIAGNLMGDYISLDRTNRYTNKLWKCAMKAAEATKLKTPSLKRLLA